MQGRILKASMGMLMAWGTVWGVTALYLANLDDVDLGLEQAIQGMNEYEVCQYAVKNYDEKMVEKMGCMDGSLIIEDQMAVE